MVVPQKWVKPSLLQGKTKESKNLSNFLTRRVYPKIRCTTRAGQHRGNNQTLDKRRFEVTWASCDRALWVAAYGEAADLETFVADPKRWIEGRADVVLVVIDETPLWLQLRAEEKVSAGQQKEIT